MDGDLTAWSSFGAGPHRSSANELTSDVPARSYRPNGWALDGINLCTYRFTVTADLTMPETQKGIESGWGFGIGTCMTISSSGEPRGAYLQYGFGQNVDNQVLIAGIVRAPAYNRYIPFINDTPSKVPTPLTAGAEIELDWTIDVRGDRAKATGTLNGVPTVKAEWLLSGQDRLPSKCGPGGGNGIVLRVWGTTVRFRGPLVAPLTG